MSWQAYQEYKQTRASFLNKKPFHWKEIQLKQVVEGCVNGIWGGEAVGDGQDIAVIRVADFDRDALRVSKSKLTFRKISEQEKKGRLLKRGDLLLEKSGGGEKTLVGQLVVFDETFEAVTSNFVAKMTPKCGFDSGFLKFLFSRFYSENINYCSIKQNTGIQNLDSGTYLSEVAVFPPLQEQQKIAQFLDHETAKIDTLIDKQQQLIALLKEKRQAVISHAVTKGLDPDAPMRDSGVEWLGEVPVGWDVAKLSYRFEILLGKMLDERKISGNFLKPYLRNTDVQWGKINSESLPQMDFRPEEQSRYTVKKGDLLVCEGGEVGRSAIWERDEECFYQKALHRLRPINSARDCTRFFFYHLFSAANSERFSGGLGKATIAHLPAESFRQYVFCFPAFDEQRRITAYLDEQCAKFDRVDQRANSTISLLKEKKSALISAAVTGKIDVRDWQPPTPQ